LDALCHCRRPLANKIKLNQIKLFMCSKKNKNKTSKTQRCDTTLISAPEKLKINYTTGSFLKAYVIGVTSSEGLSTVV